jgi:hypothetical protein
MTGRKSHSATRFNSGSGLRLGLFIQTNKLTVGKARQSGNSVVAAEVFQAGLE